MTNEEVDILLAERAIQRVLTTYSRSADDVVYHILDE